MDRPEPSRPYSEVEPHRSGRRLSESDGASGLYSVAAAKAGSVESAAPREGLAGASALSGALRFITKDGADYEVVLAAVARTFAEALDCGCVLHCREEDGSLLLAGCEVPAAQCRDGFHPSSLRQAHLAVLHEVADPFAAERALDTGAPVVVTGLGGRGGWSRATLDAARTYRALGLHSVAFVSLRAFGESVGLLTLFRGAKSPVAFVERDLQLAQPLAAHAALALENARLRRSVAGERQERKLAERGQARAVEQLRHADRLATVGKLIAGVAHELGSPLNVIGGHAQLINEGEIQGDELQTSARVILGQVGRATATVRQLLDFARRGGTAADHPLDLLAVAEGVVALLTSFARKSGVSLSVAGERVVVRAEEDALAQVFTNLLLNAVQASPDGGEVTITLSSVVRKRPGNVVAREYARAEVRDQGFGISDEVRAHLFEPFFTTKPRGTGTGLGLSVVQGIVQAHGGWIAVETASQGGAVFAVFLPRVVDAPLR
jgi:signal transduction histidine kinase